MWVLKQELLLYILKIVFLFLNIIIFHIYSHLIFCLLFNKGNVLKIYAVNAGMGLGLATPLITAVSVTFLLTRSAFIQSQNVFVTTDTRSSFTSSARRESSEHRNGTGLGVRALLLQHKDAGARCSLYHYIPKHKINYVHAKSWSVKSWSYQNGD